MDAIRNSLAYGTSDEKEAALVLAATQRPNYITAKHSKITDAPEVYPYSSTENRVRFLTNSVTGDILIPQFKGSDM